jgi:hypothetical protein
MTKKILTAILLLLLAVTQFSMAQSKAEIAHQKGGEAIKLMDSGAIEESLKLLKEAKKHNLSILNLDTLI